jgi:hypothetical protein
LSQLINSGSKKMPLNQNNELTSAIIQQSIVPPLILDEKHVFIFRFWFSDTLQSGMYYQNELFCQLMTVEAHQRSQLYQLSCKFTQNGKFVLTCSKTNCRLWGDLRGNFVKELLLNPSVLKRSSKLSVQNTPYCEL